MGVARGGWGAGAGLCACAGLWCGGCGVCGVWGSWQLLLRRGCERRGRVLGRLPRA